MFMRPSARVQGCVRIFSSASSAVSYTCCKWYYVIFKIFFLQGKCWAGAPPLLLFFLFLFCVLRVRSSRAARPHDQTVHCLPVPPGGGFLSSGSPLNLLLPLPQILSLSVCRIGNHPRAKTATGAPASGPRVGWRAATERSPRTGRALCCSLRLGGREGFVFFS